MKKRAVVVRTVRGRIIPVPMPEIILESQARDYVNVKPSSKSSGHLTIEQIATEFWHGCLSEALAVAYPGATKEQIYTCAQANLKRILDQGERYCMLLWGELAREGLSVMTFSSRPRKMRTFSKVCRDFQKWWEANPRKHNAHLLAEYL